METRGRLKDVYEDWKTNKFLVSFLVDHINEDDVNALSGLEGIDIIAKPHREKRSLSANAYFHVLVTKIAEKTHSSLQEVKNKQIREYGQYEYIDDQIPTYMIKAEYIDQILAKEGVHFCPVGFENIKDQSYVRMAVMRGSHTYDSREMSRLIDGTVADAKELGIETLPPDQIERMVKSWHGTTATDA